MAMSNHQNVGEPLFHLRYAPPASPRELSKALYANNGTSYTLPFHVIKANSIQITRGRKNDNKIGECQHTDGGFRSSLSPGFCQMMALLVPPTLTHKFLYAMESLRDKDKHVNITDDLESDFRESMHELLKDGKSNQANLPRLSIYGIITSSNGEVPSLPADVVLFELDNRTFKTAATESNNFAKDILEYCHLLNHETVADIPWSVMKAFPICMLASFYHSSAIQTKSDTQGYDENTASIDNPELPCCPVCLHLIEPTVLGLPELKREQKCSPWCSTFNSTSRNGENNDPYILCANEMKLEPLPPPAKCNACDVICRRDTTLGLESYSSTQSNAIATPSVCLTCHKCGMTTTLWVCLTCGVVGCGRYTLKHAADHFTSTGHPYSLELATMRIWDYQYSSFVHRRDLMECPVLATKWGKCRSDSMQFSSPLVASLRSSSALNENALEPPSQQHLKDDTASSSHSMQNGLSPLHHSHPACQGVPVQNSLSDKLSYPPKKSMMVSEEYEALLQSALEDQAMHFEGEISRLRAQLASSQIGNSEYISDVESGEIHALEKDSEQLKCELEYLSSALLETQYKESKNRALSQKLLREQQISKELLDKLRRDTRYEHDSCKQRMDDLELQIDDLTANLRMRTQIAQSEELSQAQIVGTLGGNKVSINNKRKGKKSLRFGRKW